MRSDVGPLLLGLGLFMVAGCALPERSLSRNEDFQSRYKNRLNRRVTNETSADGELAFKSPSLRPQTSTADRGDSKSDTNDSALSAETPKNSDGQSPFQGGGFVAGYSSDQKKSSSPHAQLLTSDNRNKSTSGPSSTMPGNENNPVQLQGLELVDSHEPNSKSGAQLAGTATQNPRLNNTLQSDGSSTIQNWSDRPGVKSAGGLSNSSVLGGTSSEAIRQTNHSNLAQFSGKPITDRSLPPLPWQTDLDQLIAQVEQSLAQSKPDPELDRQSEYTRRQAYLRLLYMMAQRQEEALTAIPGIASTQQEFWQQMVWAMSNSLDAVQFPEAGERASQAVSPLNAALKQIREEAYLSIKNAAFCRKITYFGNYERFLRNEFTPGQEVLLYTEIENFVSVPTADGEYRTSLKSVIEITDPKGKIVWQKMFPPTEDFCRNPRRDYFHNYQFRIPEEISMGTYVLKLTIADELSQKRVSNSLNFVVK